MPSHLRLAPLHEGAADPASRQVFGLGFLRIGRLPRPKPSGTPVLSVPLTAAGPSRTHAPKDATPAFPFNPKGDRQALYFVLIWEPITYILGCQAVGAILFDFPRRCGRGEAGG